jgi:hypothetical protein
MDYIDLVIWYCLIILAYIIGYDKAKTKYKNK